MKNMLPLAKLFIAVFFHWNLRAGAPQCQATHKQVAIAFPWAAIVWHFVPMCVDTSKQPRACNVARDVWLQYGLEHVYFPRLRAHWCALLRTVGCQKMFNKIVRNSPRIWCGDMWGLFATTAGRMCFFLPVVHVFLDGCQDGFGSCAVFVSLDNGTIIWCHLTWGKHCTFSRVSIAPCSFGQRGIFLM